MRTRDWIFSTSDITSENITHLVVPGRGRTEDGMGLSRSSAARADAAARFFAELHIAEKGGVIVCTGYKTPHDQRGESWSDGQETFQGKPEAYSVCEWLILKHGIDPKYIVIEPHSIDTVTNFAFSRKKLPDKRPFGIVSHRSHLERIMKIITPRLIEQPHIGLVVPELSGATEQDSFIARTTSRLIVAGLTPETPDEEVMHRAERAINLINFPSHAHEIMRNAFRL